MIALPIFNTQSTEQISTATFDPCFTGEECDKILEDFLVEKPMTAGTNGEMKQNNRETLVHPIPYDEQSEWLYMKLADRIARANQFHYDFNISGIYGDLQLLEYTEGMHYGWHMDIGQGPAAHRKLSIIVQLSEPDDYEGGDVQFMASEDKRTLPRDKGQLCVFPSYILHRVKPVTKGKRYALVTWVMDQRRFS